MANSRSVNQFANLAGQETASAREDLAREGLLAVLQSFGANGFQDLRHRFIAHRRQSRTRRRFARSTKHLNLVVEPQHLGEAGERVIDFVEILRVHGAGVGRDHEVIAGVFLNEQLGHGLDLQAGIPSFPQEQHGPSRLLSAIARSFQRAESLPELSIAEGPDWFSRLSAVGGGQRGAEDQPGQDG